jgi:amidohydrolase family protein
MAETPSRPEPARDCPGPAPNPHGPTRYTVPPGAVDTHAHVIGLPPAYPFVAERAYTPPAAPQSAYLAMLDGTGMTHGVLIQVSVHGSDNRLMLETLRSNRQRLRGIAVMPLGLSDKAYRDMKLAGVVGLRLNVLFGGGIGLERLEDYARCAANSAGISSSWSGPSICRRSPRVSASCRYRLWWITWGIPQQRTVLRNQASRPWFRSCATAAG